MQLRHFCSSTLCNYFESFGESTVSLSGEPEFSVNGAIISSVVVGTVGIMLLNKGGILVWSIGKSYSSQPSSVVDSAGALERTRRQNDDTASSDVCLMRYQWPTRRPQSFSGSNSTFAENNNGMANIFTSQFSNHLLLEIKYKT